VRDRVLVAFSWKRYYLLLIALGSYGLLVRDVLLTISTSWIMGLVVALVLLVIFRTSSFRGRLSAQAYRLRSASPVQQYVLQYCVAERLRFAFDKSLSSASLRNCCTGYCVGICAPMYRGNAGEMRFSCITDSGLTFVSRALLFRVGMLGMLRL
jgi:hypothetical protein